MQVQRVILMEMSKERNEIKKEALCKASFLVENIGFSRNLGSAPLQP